MPYRPIDTEARLSIVKQYWAGQKIAELERQYNVDRDSIHIWINKAELALIDALSPKKPGPKKDPMDQLLKRNTELEQINRKLQIQLQELSQNSHIKIGVDRRQIDLRPGTCPTCGCDTIWKNGTYVRKDAHVQRFRCSSCGTKIFLDVKKTP
ncbi:MAG: hypothetical protein A4E53_03317 [Pelotomaculum sp. PtaB.Bin104]|nr:MAG: hypothetical protein A4E53_03317 [Pelotomaculum sp. PtaB.Bin104]